MSEENPMSTGAEEKDYDQLMSLIETVERLRLEKFPHLDSALVREILRLHADAGAADAELARGVEKEVEGRLTLEG